MVLWTVLTQTHTIEIDNTNDLDVILPGQALLRGSAEDVGGAGGGDL